MIEINLIPDVKRELLRAQRARGIVISVSIFTSFVAAGVVVLLLMYMYGVQAIRSSYLDGQITDKWSQLSKVDDLSKILTIQQQLASISTLNDSKNMTSRVYDIVSAITPSDDTAVSFSQITLSPTGDTNSTDSTTPTDGSGQIRLEGQTSGYDSMEAFKKRVANTIFQYKTTGSDDTNTAAIASNISTSDISYGENTDGTKVLRFTLSFDYPPALLSPKSNNITYKLNVNGNVTDSYLGIPRFTDRAADITGGGN